MWPLAQWLLMSVRPEGLFSYRAPLSTPLIHDDGDHLRHLGAVHALGGGIGAVGLSFDDAQRHQHGNGVLVHDLILIGEIVVARSGGGDNHHADEHDRRQSQAESPLEVSHLDFLLLNFEAQGRMTILHNPTHLRERRKSIEELERNNCSMHWCSTRRNIFTSGGTESNNWAIKGIAFSDPVKHAFITSVIEHHAILRPCADIERMGHPVSYLPVDYTGTVNIETLAENINSDTRLVSVMTANNEIGSVQDIPALAAIAHSCGAIFHTDAVQAVGHIEIDVNLLGVDMLSASAHKFNGPKGIGFLYVRKGTPLMSYASGGGQEHHMRAGTENVASIVGMATALKKNVATMKDTASHLALLENRLLVGLSNANIRFTRNGSEVHIPEI